jgi:cytochrome c-type biogenesis protein
LSESVSVFVSFTAGLLSVASPCLLTLVPVYLAYLSGVSLSDDSNERRRLRVLLNAVVFCAGFTVIFVLMGASATFLGSILLQHQRIIRKVGGALVVLFGLFSSGLIRLPFLDQERRMQVSGNQGYLRSFVVGMAFAAGWSPCVGPILGSVLLYAGTRDTVWQGIGLLAAYSAGISVPFILLGASLGQASKMLDKLRSHSRTISIVSGVFLVLLGVGIYFDLLKVLSAYISF